MSEAVILDRHGSPMTPSDVQTRDSLENPSVALTEALTGGLRSAAGVSVTTESALGIAAFFACIRNISEDIAKIPIELIRRRGRDVETLHDHALWWLLNVSPNPEMTAFDFRRTLLAHSLAFQGGFAEVVRNGLGEVMELWPMDPTRIRIRRVQEVYTLFPTAAPNDIIYEYHYSDAAYAVLRPEQVLHVHCLAFDGIAAAEITLIAKEAIGAAIAVQRQNATFFGNGAVISGSIEVPGAISKNALANLRESFRLRHEGPNNANKTLILEEGAKYNAMGSDPERSQMVQSMEFHVSNIARLFRMPPHKIQDLSRATFSNIESQGREYVGDCLMGHSVGFEQAAKLRLLSGLTERDVWFRHDFRDLLRAESDGMASWYNQMFNVGAMSQNDIRAMEGLPPIQNGDDYYISRAMGRVQDNQPEDDDDWSDGEGDGGDGGGEPADDPGDEAPSVDEIRETLIAELTAALIPPARLWSDRQKRGKGFQTGDDFAAKAAEVVARNVAPILAAANRDCNPGMIGDVVALARDGISVRGWSPAQWAATAAAMIAEVDG